MRDEFSMKLIMMFMVALAGFWSVSSWAYIGYDPSEYCGRCKSTEDRTMCEREKADLEYRKARARAMEKSAQNGNCIFND